MKVKFLSWVHWTLAGRRWGVLEKICAESGCSRGIELEDITAVTKISQRHLIALEQERFRLLPGGILSKGIVRGYAGALGLDQQDWTERFLQGLQRLRPDGR